MSERFQFDTNIKRTEKEIVNFMMKSPLFLGQDPKRILILAIFITRKRLTQRKLRELTSYHHKKPYSSGTISTIINKLIEQGTIRKAEISSTGEITYEMDSVEEGLLNCNIQSLKDMTVIYEEKLREIKNSMENEKKKLHSLHGFNELYKIVSLFYNTIDFSKKMIDILDKELNALKNEPN